jgi:hypothetical protein
VAVVVLVKQVEMVAMVVLAVVALTAGQVLVALEHQAKDLPGEIQLQVLVNMPPQGAEVLALLEVGHQ